MNENQAEQNSLMEEGAPMGEDPESQRLQVLRRAGADKD